MIKTLFFCVLIYAAAVQCQYSVWPSVRGSAGGVSTGLAFSIAGTAGQQAIGVSQGSSAVQAGFWYALFDVPVAIEVPVQAGDVVEFSLGQNTPNPFNPLTSIPFSVQEPCRVQLHVYDVQGREVGRIVDKVYAPGSYRAVFGCRSLPSGTYCYRIRMGTFTDTKKMVVVK